MKRLNHVFDLFEAIFSVAREDHIGWHFFHLLDFLITFGV